MKQLSATLKFATLSKFEATILKKTHMGHLVDSPGVAPRLRQWLSVKTVIKTTIRFSVLQNTVLQIFYDNFIGSFLFFFVTLTKTQL